LLVRRFVPLIIPVLLLAGAAYAPADILYLRDGSRHYGELISRGPQSLQFRVVTGPAGTDSAIRTYATAMVARVEQTGQVDTPPAARAQPIEATPAKGPDYEQLVREGCELLADGDYAAAVIALQMVAKSARGEDLQRAERLAEKLSGVSLAEVLARTRMFVACGEGRERGFRLKFATRYELPALARLLQAHAETLLAREYGGHTVREWGRRVDEIEELEPYSWALFEDAARAHIAVVAWIRFDPEMRGQRDLRNRLTQVVLETSLLAAKIRDLPGYTSPEVHKELKPIKWIDPVEPPPVVNVKTLPEIVQPALRRCGPLQPDEVSTGAAGVGWAKPLETQATDE
jgi:hypothetical protein